MNDKDADASEAETYNVPIVVKSEPLVIKDEFPATEDVVYNDIIEKTHLVIIKSECSSASYNDKDAGELDEQFHTSYQYNVKLESSAFIKMEHSTATSDRKLITATDFSESEERDYGLKNAQIHHCDICQKSCGAAEDLIAHRYTHTEETNFTCLICRNIFHMKQHLHRHMLNNHTNLSPFQCDICHKSFTRKYDLIVHKRIHSGEKPYECIICQKSFTIKNGLTIHLRTHTGEKPYECDICHKSFTQKGDLNKHKRIHTGVKPYECGICKKSFIRTCELNVHERIHTGEKPYECDICHKSFAHKGNIIAHKRIHTGEK